MLIGFNLSCDEFTEAVKNGWTSVGDPNDYTAEADAACASVSEKYRHDFANYKWSEEIEAAVRQLWQLHNSPLMKALE
jgi:hypothetical protein